MIGVTSMEWESLDAVWEELNYTETRLLEGEI